jgi:hypothetical protein
MPRWDEKRISKKHRKRCFDEDSGASHETVFRRHRVRRAAAAPPPDGLTAPPTSARSWPSPPHHAGRRGSWYAQWFAEGRTEAERACAEAQATPQRRRA